jgi:hypothetical protein
MSKLLALSAVIIAIGCSADSFDRDTRADGEKKGDSLGETPDAAVSTTCDEMNLYFASHILRDGYELLSGAEKGEYWNRVSNLSTDETECLNSLLIGAAHRFIQEEEYEPVKYAAKRFFQEVILASPPPDYCQL